MRRNHGFTITEILIVISIIGVISLIATPSLIHYQKKSKLKSEARILATNLRLAQQFAITEQNRYAVELSLLNGSYDIVNLITSEVIKSIILDPEVDIATTTNLTNNIIQFNPTGAVLEAGTIALINTKHETSTLEIKPSGFVDILEQ